MSRGSIKDFSSHKSRVGIGGHYVVSGILWIVMNLEDILYLVNKAIMVLALLLGSPFGESTRLSLPTWHGWL